MNETTKGNRTGLNSAVDALFEATTDLADAANAYLHSEQGKRLRRGWPRS